MPEDAPRDVNLSPREEELYVSAQQANPIDFARMASEEMPKPKAQACKGQHTAR